MKYLGVIGCFHTMLLLFFLSTEAMSGDPADFTRGLALRLERRDAEAIDAFKKVLAVTPHHVDALVHMGAALEDLGDRKAAERAYRQALVHGPDHAAARRDLDRLLAARDIRTTNPRNRATEELLINKGLVHLDRNEFDAALAKFRILRGFNPDDPRPLFYTAIVWERRRDFDRARAAYQQAVRAFPGYAPLRVNFVLFLIETGDREAAGREAQAAAEAVPGDARVRYLARLLTADITASSDVVDAAPMKGARER